MIVSAIWLPATFLAALFQAWRTAMQQRARLELSVNGAGLVRYVYGAPVAAGLLVTYTVATGGAPPSPSAAFFAFAFAAGLAQIAGTSLLILAFGYRNFVVGTAYAKTEVVQSAVFAFIILGERLAPLVWCGVGLGVAGVLTLSVSGRRMTAAELVGSILKPAALCGLGAGASFALAAVLLKQATLALAIPDLMLAALSTLVVVVWFQAAAQGAYTGLREPQQVRAVLATWRTSAQVGVLSTLGSACWYIGFAMAPVALVRAVGQIEVLFSLAFARLYLRERTNRAEAIGLLLIGGGVALALFETSLRR